jgi:ribosome-binding factor A
MSHRTVRINELVQRELSDILRKRYQAEAVTLTITEVRVAPDLRDARVFVSVIGTEEEAELKLRWLRKQSAAIREELSKRIVIKFLPKFEYRLDRSLVRTNKVLGLLDDMIPAPTPGHEPNRSPDETDEPGEDLGHPKEKRDRDSKE